MSKIVLLINKNDILKRTSLGGNVDIDKLLPHINNAQEVEIIRLLGSNLYDKLIELVRDGTLGDDLNKIYAELLDDYVKPALVFYTMAYFLPFHQYQLANSGISRTTGENVENIQKEEVDFLVQKYRDLGDSFAIHLDKFLCDNSEAFDVLYLSDQNINKKVAKFNVGLFLG